MARALKLNLEVITKYKISLRNYIKQVTSLNLSQGNSHSDMVFLSPSWLMPAQYLHKVGNRFLANPL
jgi:hypothetical protein